MRHLRPLLLAASLPFLACVTIGPAAVLRDQVATERQCDEEQLQVSGLGQGRYRVQGCGVDRTYLCSQREGWTCTQ